MSEPQSEAGGGEAATPVKPPPPSPLSGCYLLIVVGEPHSPEHKDIILQKIAKGFLSWDIQNAHVDLEKELIALTAQAPEGEEARNGERLIQYATENLVTEVLIHPQLNTLSQCIRNLLSSFTRHRHLIHAGYTFAASGSWILQDGTFSLADFIDAFQESEVQRVLRAYDNCVTVDVHCSPEGDWSTERMLKESFSKSCKVRINPDDTLTAGGVAIGNFINYLGPFLVPASIEHLLEPSDVVGNIRFSHPTLYVFPGGQGDAALFGINGFNMLIDGGFNRKACFWDFARHLDRLDAVLLTRLNNANVNGISAVLHRKKQSTVYPQIGHFFCNLQERRHAASPDGDKDRDPLLINLLDEGQGIVMNLRHLQLKPHPCYRDGNQAEPINLYHKVGHGKLDMYVVSPTRDSREVKEFLAKWNSNDMRLFLPGKKEKDGFHFPVQNLVSICALLVWQPANPSDTITRILFPGSCPQHKIFEGLDKIRHLEFLKHAVCSTKSISPSTSAVAMTARTGGKQKSTPAVIDKILPGESMVKTPPKPLDIGKQPVVKAATIPVSGVGQTKPSTPVSATTTPTTTKAPPQAKPKAEKLTSKTEPPKSKTETNKLLEGDKHVSKVEKYTDKTSEKTEKISEKTSKTVSETKTKEHKSKIETKTSVTKSRIDSKPPRSLERRKEKVGSEKKGDAKSSPTTPKRSVEHKINGVATKTEVAKASRAPSKGRPSPTSTPAKSAKEANNRKVVESKYHVARAASSTRAPTSKPAKKEQQENLSMPLKPERKPISRRPKPSSPSKSSKAPGSPAKSSSAKSTPTPSVKSDKDGVIRKSKAELEKVTTDSSAVSTPSTAEPETMPIKSKLATDEIVPSTMKHITDQPAIALETSVVTDVSVEAKVLEDTHATITMKDKELQREDIQAKVSETLKAADVSETEPGKPSRELAIASQEEPEEDEVTEDKESEIIEVLEEKHVTQDIEITEEERTEDIEDEEETTEPGKTLEEEMNIHTQEIAKHAQEIEDEEDEYLIIEKEEVEQMMEDSLQEESTESHIPDKKEIEEDEGELKKHLRDEVESEKKKKSEEYKEMEKEKIIDSDVIAENLKTDKKKVAREGKEETKIYMYEDQFIPVDKEKFQDATEEEKELDGITKTEVAEHVSAKPEIQSEISKTDKITPETKEKIQEEVQEIISSAEKIATKTKIETEKVEDGIEERIKLLDESIDEKKDSEDLDDQKETSSISPEEKVDLSSEKLREMTEETRGTDHKIDEDHDESLPLKGVVLRDITDQKYTAEESQPDEKFSTTVESGATTAPTLPEDERIPLDEIKEIVEEKYVKEETKEEKPITVPAPSMDQPTTLPHVVVPSTIGVFESRGPQSLIHQRDIVKTPDEVADLPVHEEVDTGMYESEDDFPKVKDYEQEKKHEIPEPVLLKKQEITDKESKPFMQDEIPEAKIDEPLQEPTEKVVFGEKKLEEFKKEIKVTETEIQKQDEAETQHDEDEKESIHKQKPTVVTDTKVVDLDTTEIKYVADVSKDIKDQRESDFTDNKSVTLMGKDERESVYIKADTKQDKLQELKIEEKEKPVAPEEEHIETESLDLFEKDKEQKEEDYITKKPDENKISTEYKLKEVDMKVSEPEITSDIINKDETDKILHDTAEKDYKFLSELNNTEFSTQSTSKHDKDENEAMKKVKEQSPLPLDSESSFVTKSSSPNDLFKVEDTPTDKVLDSTKEEKQTKKTCDTVDVGNKLVEDILQAGNKSKEETTLKYSSHIEELHTEMQTQKDGKVSHGEETKISDMLHGKLEVEESELIKDIGEIESHVEKFDSVAISKAFEPHTEMHKTSEKEISPKEGHEQMFTEVQSNLHTEDSVKKITGHFIETERNVLDQSAIKEPEIAFTTEDSSISKLEFEEKEAGKEEPIIFDTDSDSYDKMSLIEHKLFPDTKVSGELLGDDSEVSKISPEFKEDLQEAKVICQGITEQEKHKIDTTHKLHESEILLPDRVSGVHTEDTDELVKDKTEVKKTELETAQIIDEQKTDRIEIQSDDKLSIVKDFDMPMQEKTEDVTKADSTTKDYIGLREVEEKVEKQVAGSEKTDIMDTKDEKKTQLHEEHAITEIDTKSLDKNLQDIPSTTSEEKPVKTLVNGTESTAPGDISAAYLEIIDKLQQKLPSTDEVVDVLKDSKDKMFSESGSDEVEYKKINYAADTSVLEAEEHTTVKEDMHLLHDKKSLPSTTEKTEKLQADDVQSLEQHFTKQVTSMADTNVLTDHFKAQDLQDLSAPQVVKSDLPTTVSKDQVSDAQIHRITGYDDTAVKLPTRTIVSDKLSDSDDDDDLQDTRSLKSTTETDPAIPDADVKKFISDEKDRIDSKVVIKTMTKEVDDDLGKDYEGDVEEDEDDDYVGSEYVDSGLEEEPVYSKLAAAAVPEYVTVTPDSAPPSPGDHRIPDRIKDVLITEKDEKTSLLIADTTATSLTSTPERYEQDVSEEEKFEKESEVRGKLHSSVSQMEKAMKDVDVSIPYSTQESAQLLTDTKSESGMTPHSTESNKTHDIKGDSDTDKQDSEDETHEQVVKSPMPVIKAKDGEQTFSSESSESGKVMEEYTFKSEILPTQDITSKVTGDQVKFFKHETGEASLLDDLEGKPDKIQDVNKKFLASERGISVDDLKETDTHIYDINFSSVETSKPLTEKQITTSIADVKSDEDNGKISESKEILATEFEKGTAVTSSKLDEFKADQQEPDDKSSSSVESTTDSHKVSSSRFEPVPSPPTAKEVEKEQEKMEKESVDAKDMLSEVSPSKDDSQYALLDEKSTIGDSVAELESLGRKSSGISESEISDIASVISATHDSEIKGKEKYADTLATDTAEMTTVLHQGQQDVSSTSTVRRMVVTASSEDGGVETEVCSTDSLTITSSQYSERDKSQNLADSIADSKDLESDDASKQDSDKGIHKMVPSLIKTSETNGHIYSSDKEDYDGHLDDDYSKESTKTTTTKTITKIITHTDPNSAMLEKEDVCGSDFSDEVSAATKVTKSTHGIVPTVASSLDDSLVHTDEKSISGGSPEELGSPKHTHITEELELRSHKTEQDYKTFQYDTKESLPHEIVREDLQQEMVPESSKITTTTTVIKKSLVDDVPLADEQSSHYGSPETLSHEIVPESSKITTKTTVTTTTTVLKKTLGDEINVADVPSSHYDSQESLSHESVPGSPKIVKTITSVLKMSLADDVIPADVSLSHYGSQESLSHETVTGPPKITTKTTTTVLKKSLGDITAGDEPSSPYDSKESLFHESVSGSPKITKKTTTTTTTTVVKKSLGDDIALIDEPSSHYDSQESISHESVPGSPRVTKTTTTTTVLKKSLGDDTVLKDDPSSKTITTTVTTVTKKLSGDSEETTTTTKAIDIDGEKILTKITEKDGKVIDHFSAQKPDDDDETEIDSQELSCDSIVKKLTDKIIDSSEDISSPVIEVEKQSEKFTELESDQTSLENKITKLREEQTTVSEKDGVRSSTVTTVTKTLTKEIGDVDFPTALSSGVAIIKREAIESVRSGTPGSDSDRDLEYGGPSTPHSDISSGQVSRAPTHVWGESSEGRPDSEDDDRPGSPLSTSSQLGHSPPPHFEDVTSDSKHYSPAMVMTGSFYGNLPDDPLQQLLQEHSIKKVSDPIPISTLTSGKAGDEIRKTELASSFKHYSPQESSSTGDLDFEKALYEHRIARGEDFAPKTSTVTYVIESKSSPGHKYKVESHQSSDVNGQKHYDDGQGHESEVVMGEGTHGKFNGKPSVESTSVTSYHISSEPSSSLKKVTTTTTTVTGGGEHDPLFHHQITSSSSSSSTTTTTTTFPEPPQGFGLSGATKTADNIKDPIEGWGKPLGLPAPIPPPTNDTDTSGEIVATTPSNKSTPKKERKSMQTKKTMLMNENNKIKDGSNKKRPESPVKQGDRKGSSTNKDTGLRNAKATGSPIYVDLSYVPHNGNSYYSSVEFFKKVRARYYVFSGTDPSRDVYNALLEAKQTWDDKELEVTIIPTYDTDTLGYWVAENEDLLAKCKIDLSPSASRCTINLQDHETSCSAYRLEF